MMWLSSILKCELGFPCFGLWLALFTFAMLPLVSAQNWTDPQTTFVEVGTNTSLRCAFNGSSSSSTTITWVDSGTPIFEGENPITQLEKYDNFHVTVTREDAVLESVMHITRSALEDEGMFSCSYGDPDDMSGFAYVHVEVASNFSMSEVPPMTEGQEYTVTCTSSGSRPPESITWSLQGHPLNLGNQVYIVTSPQPRDDGLSELESSVTFMASKCLNGAVLTCSTGGHMVPGLNQTLQATLQVLDPVHDDTVELVFFPNENNGTLWISCQSRYTCLNPIAPTYTYHLGNGDSSVLIENGSRLENIGLPSQCTNISCSIYNGVKEVTASKIYCPKSEVCDEDLYRRLAIAFIIMSCLLVIVVTVFVFQRWRSTRLHGGYPGGDYTSTNGVVLGQQANRGNTDMYRNELPLPYTTNEREITAKQIGAKVPARNIRFYSQIGSIGATPFGQVWKGEIRGVPGKEKKKLQAAIRDLSGIDGVKDRLLETVNTIWKLPTHINLVRCLGCCMEQTFIVYEYIPYGTLLTYLQTNAGRRRSTYRAYVNVRSIVRRVKEPELLTFAWQIAKGMEFLSSQKIIHGNLRASNVLLSENKICKIADYGLTSIIKPVLHRWQSPESMLTGTCSTESDVWSYGVLLWELVTLGAQPYPGIGDEELKEKITQGYKMRRPRHCGENLFNIITDCWRTDMDQRSNFRDMQNKIGWMLESSNDYLSLNRMSDEDIYEDIPDLENS